MTSLDQKRAEAALEHHQLVQAAEATLNLANKLGLTMVELDAMYQEALGGGPEPPPIDPPPPGEVTWPDPHTFGCQLPAGQLTRWTFAPIAGAGRPAGVATLDGQPWNGGDIGDVPVMLRRFKFGPAALGGSTHLGVLSGVSRSNPGLTIRDAVIEGANKWGASEYQEAIRIKDVTFKGTFPEHDAYIRIEGGGAGFSFENLRSINTGSQALQIAQREWEGPSMDPGGPILVNRWYVENHGGGDRASQPVKSFSPQLGTQDNQRNGQLQHTVSMRAIWVDNTGRQESTGVFFLGDALDTKILSVHAKGNQLSQDCAVIDTGSGPVEIGAEGWSLNFTSGEGGPAVLIRDLSRPVKIHPAVSGNITIRTTGGQVLAHITDGYEQNWGAV